ncbi:hypothetical protein WAI453_004478 [Rhynchosporium graminicola]
MEYHAPPPRFSTILDLEAFACQRSRILVTFFSKLLRTFTSRSIPNPPYAYDSPAREPPTVGIPLDPSEK